MLDRGPADFTVALRGMRVAGEELGPVLEYRKVKRAADRKVLGGE
jgi:hypothetical protein